MSHQQDPRGKWQLPPFHVTASAYEDPARGRGVKREIYGAPWHTGRQSGAAFEHMRRQLEQHYSAYEAQYLQQTAEEIEQVKKTIVLPPDATALDRIEQEKNAVELFRERLRSELIASQNAARAFSGEDPLGKGADYFHHVFNERYKGQPPQHRAHAFHDWETAYQAALKAQIQAKALGMVTEEAERVNSYYQQAVQQRAQEQVRHRAAEVAAREQLQRQAAAEQAAKEEVRQKLLADQIASELISSSKQPASLVVPLAELKPLTGTLTPGLGAGRVATLLSASHVRARAPSIAASLAKYLNDLIRSADQWGTEAARQAARTLESLRNTIQDFGGFFSGSLPVAEVLPGNQTDLSNIASRQEAIDVPGWGQVLGEVAGAVVLDDSFVNAPAHVEVRNATFDAASKTWSVALPASPGTSLVWTPIAPQTDSSTALPAASPAEMPYIGIPLSPVESETFPLPVSPPELHGLITVFPAESGVAPLFTVYSSPYPGATVKGVHSGRFYNPDKAGGSIQNLQWEGAALTRAGIDLVKLHTGRLSYSAANVVMIERLESILAGELEMSDTDKRYYTHELRELERYRSVGVDDGPVPEDIMAEVWNNAHTATLEDFKLKDDSDLLYTPEAKAADAEQAQREYEDILRGGQ